MVDGNLGCSESRNMNDLVFDFLEVVDVLCIFFIIYK